MNYIKQLNAFYELLIVNPLSSSALCLYSILLHINNKCNWITEFTVANSTLQTFTSLSRVALDRARNELIQKGYIKYKKGTGNQAGKYLIVCFDTQNDTQNDTQIVTQNDTQSENINKQKLKLKQKHIEKENKRKEIYSRIIDYLNKKIGSNYKSTADKTKQLIDARLNAGFTEQDFYIVIDKKCSAWLNDEKMCKYLRPETLFGNKFEGYLNEVLKNTTNTKEVEDWLNE